MIRKVISLSVWGYAGIKASLEELMGVRLANVSFGNSAEVGCVSV